MLRKLNYNAARGKQKKKKSNGAVRRIGLSSRTVGRRERKGRTDETKPSKATNRRKSKAQKV